MAQSKKGAEQDIYVTAYAVSKMLAEKGVQRKPQMIYNYLRNNLIPSEIVGSQRLIKKADAEAFVAKFAEKALSK